MEIEKKTARSASQIEQVQRKERMSSRSVGSTVRPGSKSESQLPRGSKISSSGRLVYEAEKKMTPKTSRGSDFAYVNPAFSGSVTSVNQTRIEMPVAPPTSVVREQYWACSKWPMAQRFLAVTVGILLGTVFGLALTMGLLRNQHSDVISAVLRKTHTAPD